MISNYHISEFDIVEVTNELPVNRLGGVGSVIDNLISGFNTLNINVLWFLIDHNYCQNEIEYILTQFPKIAIGSIDDLKNIKAPVAHLHTYNHNPQILKALKDKITVFTVHSLLQCEADSNDVDLGWAIRKQEELIGGCDHVVLVSYAELEHYYRLGYQKINNKVSVIYNGLKMPEWKYKYIKNKNLGFCGRLVPRKRPEYVQLILKEKGFEDYSSLIAGRGFTTYTRSLMQDPELQNRVHYLGWCGKQRLESFYQSINLLAIPSVYEPFGMVALEAMARGIPVVCSRIDGLVEILGDAAIYAEDYHYVSFKQAMTKWLDTNKTDMNKIIITAHKRHVSFFSDVIMAKNYHEQFMSLVY